MRSLRLRSRIMLVGGVPMLAVALLTVVGAISNSALRDAGTRIAQNYDVIVSATEVHQAIAQLQRTERSYLITGQDEFLDLFRLTKSRFEHSHKATATLVADQPHQSGRLELVKSKVDRWIEDIVEPRLGQTRQLFANQRNEVYLESLLSQRVGKGLSDTIRQILDDLAVEFHSTGNAHGLAVVHRLASDHVDVETGERGYLITGDREFLVPYEEGVATFDRSLQAFEDLVNNAYDRELVADQIDQLAAMAGLRDPDATRIRLMRQATRNLRTTFDHARSDAGSRLTLTIERDLLDLEAAIAQRDTMRTEIASAGVRKRVTDLLDHCEQDFDVEYSRERAHKLRSLMDDWVVKAATPEIEAKTESRRILDEIATAQAAIKSESGDELLAEARKLLDEFVFTANSRILERRQEPTDFADSVRGAALVGSIVTAIASALIAFFVVRGITRPVSRLVATTRRVARGDLATRSRLDEGAEIGELARSIDRMLDDIEELTQKTESARCAAEQANRAKSDFLANMSHEIRTPMSAIVGFADLLNDGTIDSDQRDECVRTIRRNGNLLLRIVNDILDVSKLEAGRVEIEAIPVNPNVLVHQTVALMDVRAKSKNLTVSIEFPTRLPRVICSDPTRLTQILVNLIGNAIKFTERGTIRVETALSPTHDKLIIRVIDSGIGMTEKAAARVFEAFTQADETTTRRHGGTGLGLTIARRLTELLRGTLTVASCPGKGSTFSLTLPVNENERSDLIDPSATSQNEQVLSAHPSPKQTTNAKLLIGLRVLLVDDAADNQKLIALHLRKAGASVVVRENGKAAIDAVLEADRSFEPFDAVLMDMQMPIMDGYEASRRIREFGSQVPIIAITAHAMSGDRERCLAAGCNEYETKPIAAKRLIRKIKKLYEDLVFAPMR